MPWFKPTSETVSFLAEICLLLTVLFYIVNLREKVRDTYLYIGYIIVALAFSIVAFFFNSIDQSILSVLLLLISWSSLTLYNVWFAFQFCENPFPREKKYVMSGLFILLGFCTYLWTSLWSSRFQDTPVSIRLMFHSAGFISAFYGIILFWRKIYKATSVNQSNVTSAFGMPASRSMNSKLLLKEFLNPSRTDSKAYRGFIIWLFFYLMVWVWFIIFALKLVNASIWPYSLHFFLLIAIMQSVFVFLNYAKERNSFLAKLVWLILCVALIILGFLPYALMGDGLPTQQNPHPEVWLKIFLLLVPTATAATVFIVPLVFRFNILRSLENVMKGVKRINSGDLNTEINVEVNDEIGALSKDFNQMTNSLRQYSHKMNDLVAARTLELETSLSNLKATQAQLVQSEKMASLGELTAGIAHEIQNPLNFINNFSEVNEELLSEMNEQLEKGNLGEAKSIAGNVLQNQEKIKQHGKRADAIVKNMLLHSRERSGQKEPTNLNTLTDEYLRLAYHGMRARDKSFNAKFETHFDNTIGKINIVPQDVGRVILNLINNAFYAVNEKAKENIHGYEPTVTVSTRKINEKVELRITDNGNGIAERHREKIFQPFFTTKPAGQGTGLGLSLAYDIVKAHGGEIKVETRQGEGSEFIIRLSIQP